MNSSQFFKIIIIFRNSHSNLTIINLKVAPQYVLENSFFFSSYYLIKKKIIDNRHSIAKSHGNIKT